MAVLRDEEVAIGSEVCVARLRLEVVHRFRQVLFVSEVSYGGYRKDENGT